MATATNKAKDAKLNTFRGGPDERGHFGIFGGRFVAETLMPLILDLQKRLRRRQGRSAIPRPARRISTRITPAARARSISPSG